MATTDSPAGKRRAWRYVVLLALLAGAAYLAWDRLGPTPPVAPPRVLYPIMVDGKYGLIDAAGEIVMAPRYDSLALIDSALDRHFYGVGDEHFFASERAMGFRETNTRRVKTDIRTPPPVLATQPIPQVSWVVVHDSAATHFRFTRRWPFVQRVPMDPLVLDSAMQQHASTTPEALTGLLYHDADNFLTGEGRLPALLLETDRIVRLHPDCVDGGLHPNGMQLLGRDRGGGLGHTNPRILAPDGRELWRSDDVLLSYRRDGAGFYLSMAEPPKGEKVSLHGYSQSVRPDGTVEQAEWENFLESRHGYLEVRTDDGRAALIWEKTGERRAVNIVSDSYGRFHGDRSSYPPDPTLPDYLSHPQPRLVQNGEFRFLGDAFETIATVKPTRHQETRPFTELSMLDTEPQLFLMMGYFEVVAYVIYKADGDILTGGIGRPTVDRPDLIRVPNGKMGMGVITTTGEVRIPQEYRTLALLTTTGDPVYLANADWTASPGETGSDGATAEPTALVDANGKILRVFDTPRVRPLLDPPSWVGRYALMRATDDYEFTVENEAGEAVWTYKRDRYDNIVDVESVILPQTAGSSTYFVAVNKQGHRFLGVEDESTSLLPSDCLLQPWGDKFLITRQHSPIPTQGAYRVRSDYRFSVVDPEAERTLCDMRIGIPYADGPLCVRQASGAIGYLRPDGSWLWSPRR